MCAIASIKKNTARTQTAGDHHSEEKYDQTRTKMTHKINQSNPIKRSCELDGIFSFTVSPLETRTGIKDECKSARVALQQQRGWRELRDLREVDS